MAECKCTEINNLANDIEVLSEICAKICTYSSHATEIVRKNTMLAENENNIYSDGYMVSVLIGMLDDNLELDIQNAKQAYSNKLIELSNRKTSLEIEDKEYHDNEEK